MTALGRTVRTFLIACVVAGLLHAAAEARFFSIEALEPGLRGTGKTVVRGTEIETFEVEYLGVLPEAGPVGDLILVRVSGDAIDRAGGIAAGMSGSPVYIGEQLVGAIGYGFNFADHRIGLVTPIRDMLAVMELMDGARALDTAAAGAQEARAGSSDGGAVDLPRRAYLAGSVAEAETMAASLPADVPVFAPVQTPVMATGFSPRALQRLQKGLAPLNLRLLPVQTGIAPPGADGGQLEPGAAMGVQLVRGDVNLSALGTVTYVDDGRFIGFGHPFANLGTAEFLTTTAYIFHVVPSVSMPFKLGAAGAPVGSLLQDRGAAVGGRLGPLPYMVPVSITVHDRDRGLETTRQFSVVNDPRLLTDLTVAAALSVLDRSLDRLGPGTAKVVFQIRGEGLPRPLVRDNMYYSEFDVAALSLVELMEAVNLVVHNRFVPVTITRIQVVADIQERRWTAHIEEAQPSTTEVLPGESVRITVRLRPYRGEALTEELILTVPEDASPGPVTVVVRGGGWGLEPPVDEEELLEDPEELLGENVQDLDRLIEEFVRRERNHEIVAEFYSSREPWSEETEAEDGADEEPDNGEDFPPRDASEEDEAAREEPPPWHRGYEPPERVTVSQPTDYVILGSASFDLYILPDYTRGRPRPEETEDVTGEEELLPGEGAPAAESAGDLDEGAAAGQAGDGAPAPTEEGEGPQGGGADPGAVPGPR